MFSDAHEIVRALERVRDYYDPRSTSIMTTGGASDPHAEPFRAGFISTLEERTEVVRRLGELDDRSRTLLVLWHIAGKPVTEIARTLKLSRMHCYRLRAAALNTMLGHAERSAVPA